jgi:hypothetical protein
MSVVKTISDLPNVLYHGSTSNHVKSIKSSIDLNSCSPQTDFNKGFYLTSNLDQARRWAFKKEKSHNLLELGRAKRDPDYTPDLVKGVIIYFDVDLNGLKLLNGLEFPTCTKRWSNFIYANRSDKSLFELDVEIADFHNRNSSWDYVYGPLGDGTIMGLTFAVDDGEMTLTEFNHAIQNEEYIENGYDQLSIHTKKALDFIHYKKVVLPHEYKSRKVTT